MEQLIPLALLMGVMYVLLIRPQKQRVKAQRDLVTSLHTGDEVVTIAGIIGRIVELSDDTVTLESTPGTLLRCRRGAIAGRVDPEPSAVASDDPGAGGDQ